MSASLVGSEMCIRDRPRPEWCTILCWFVLGSRPLRVPAWKCFVQSVRPRHHSVGKSPCNTAPY
eukprot:7580201-Alexandrium_andersonii.AAC.1